MYHYQGTLLYEYLRITHPPTETSQSFDFINVGGLIITS
jgi:hypothetical protein